MLAGLRFEIVSSLILVFVYATFNIAVAAAPNSQEILLNQETPIYSLNQEPYWKIADGLIDPMIEAGDNPCTSAKWHTETKGRSLPGKTVGQGGFVTYCRVIQLKEIPTLPVALNLSEIDDRDRSYVNGHLIGKTSSFDSMEPEAYDRTRVYSFDSNILKQGTNVIIVQVNGYSLNSAWGMVNERTYIGIAANIFADYYRTNVTQIIFLIVYFTVGVYFLFLFFNRRTELENLYFGLFAIGLVIYQFLRTQIKYEFFSSFLTMKRIEYYILLILFPLIFLFFRTYFRPNHPLAKRLLNLGMTIIVVLELVPILVVTFSNSPLVWSPYNQGFNLLGAAPISLLLSLIILSYNSFKKNRDAIIMLCGVIFVVSTTIIDSLSTYAIINLPRLSGYSFFIFIMSLTVVLANRFVRLHRQVEYLNQNLERKVESRTEELNQTLTQVQKLKENQDGDYFLTSLLIQPLAQLKTSSKYVTVKAYSNQKKKFLFNQRQFEIGGDISIAEQIELQGKVYTAFMNADAMGKSIQGAGGAVVIGTVFHALLGRTHSSAEFHQLPPELWLREVYRELQDVFCSFDGNMLSSAAIGLIEEEKGTLYYINAEHPTSVIFRNKEASFIEEEPMFYKFGIDLVKPIFSVIVRMLQPGDVIILGSDGRDDLILQDGSFNIDSNLFLQCVEQSSADLNQIVETILSKGAITDDLTLLRIGYREHDIITRQALVSSLLEQEKQALDLTSEQKFTEALSIFKVIFSEDPTNTEALYWISFIQSQLARKRSELRQAAIIGERVRCRMPRDTRNLEHLLKCYQRLNSPLVKSVAEDLLLINPEFQKAQQVLNSISTSNS